MPTAITTALAVLYADPNIGEDAVYEPVAGPKATVRVVVDRADTAFDVAGMAVLARSRVVQVRKEQVGELGRGDVFHIGGGWASPSGVSLEVVGDPEFDGTSGEWTAQVREVSMDSVE